MRGKDIVEARVDIIYDPYMTVLDISELEETGGKRKGGREWSSPMITT